ncbi:hypothetical protein Tco_0613078 [Tanacetum coccineum]
MLRLMVPIRSCGPGTLRSALLILWENRLIDTPTWKETISRCSFLDVSAFTFAPMVSTKVLLAGASPLVMCHLLGRLGRRVPRMAPNVEVNLCGLLGLVKVTSAVMSIEFNLVPLELNPSSPS